MRYKILFTLPIALLFIGFNFVSADTITDLQNELKAVLARITELRTELTSIESGSATWANGCINLKSNLALGMTSAEVKKLQVYLAKDPAVYPEAITSGYFGRLTEKAVQRWQAKHGVVTGGSAYSTGYGRVGPKTRSALNSSCSSSGGTASGGDNVINFSFSSFSGKAPYKASTKLVMLESQCMSYKIDWGDNSEPTTYTAYQTSNCVTGLSTKTIQHQYALAGDYSATLYAGKGNIGDLPQVMSSSIKILQGEPYVKVLNPNGGETLKLGDHVKIKWQVANQPENSAVVFYIVGQNGTYRFAKRSHRTNEFDWLVGDRVCDGNGCNVNLNVGTEYKVRAVLYSPADACIDFCDPDSVVPNFLANDESDTMFTISQLGTSGSNPLTIAHKAGKAPFTTTINVKIEPINNGVGNFEIDFGDGSSTYKIHIPAGENRVTTRSVSHTFNNSGDYYVRLRPIGATQHIGEELIQVVEQPFLLAPKTEVYAPATVRATVSLDKTCSSTSSLHKVYTIDWGDDTETTRHELRINQCAAGTSPQQSLTTKQFTHGYTTSGTYKVTLTTMVGTLRHKQVKTVILKKPTISVSPQFGFKPLTVTAKYTADESCVMKATDITYSIDWGDGTDKSYTKSRPVCGATFTYRPIEREYTHEYSTLGRYNVSLTMSKSNLGSIKTSSKEVVVDKSVLRNGWYRLTNTLDSASINMAAAIQAMLAE